MVQHGTFMWNQLVTTDQRKSGDFYAQLLGWGRKEVDAGPLGTYALFQQGGKDVAGMMNPTSEYSRTHPSWWNAFIAVSDVDACMSRVAQLGGSVLEPPHDIPSVGRACLITDPLGAPVCLMTPANAP